MQLLALLRYLMITNPFKVRTRKVQDHASGSPNNYDFLSSRIRASYVHLFTQENFSSTTSFNALHAGLSYHRLLSKETGVRGGQFDNSRVPTLSTRDGVTYNALYYHHHLG
ncbi:hypothetical protein OCU04_005827 [Sclerotinia nivalis]|uniref:Uncharacterized protein n=1 Tax=Sclerotinia nivalis TaxID=352851 RepID=A0A9X0ALR3_9HELO|nr:hypothetical protein OCU04_005827 [Sclerotinia nivalis]